MKNRLKALLGPQARVIEGSDGTLHVPLPNRLRWLEIRPVEMVLVGSRGQGWEGRDWPSGETCLGSGWEVMTWAAARVGL